LITVEMGQATPIGQAILQADLDLDAPKHIFLMIYLLWDRKVNGRKSFFYPYYEVLPPTLRNMPIFWSEEELSYLEGSHLLLQIHERSQAIADDYRAICQIAPLQQLCTLEEFKWARMCVCSRNFGLQMDGHRTSALVPHADMLNHYRPRETKWTFDEDRQAFTITSLQHISAGAQVYDSYGQKCNHRFLLNYGFAVEDNRELDGFCPNEVPIELYVDPEDRLFTEKLDFWTRGEVASSPPSAMPWLPTSTNTLLVSKSAPVVKRVRVCVSNNENTRLLFSLLRALVCNEEELRAISSPVTTDGMTRAFFGLTELHPGILSSNNNNNTPSTSYHRSCRDIRHPISIRNERAAMRLLLDVISRQFALYPTSLKQDIIDLRDLQSFPRFSNKRHAKIQVRGEKEVLQHFSQWARTALDVLDVMEEELKEERGSVEVKLTSHGRTVTEERPGFDYVIRRMEDDVDTTVHHTVLRYCADVLGSLRREEFKNIRRQRTSRTIGYI
jgi:protein-histidine N-methyltransferase